MPFCQVKLHIITTLCSPPSFGDVTLGLFPVPTNVITDFQMAVFNSIRNVFGPGLENNGCFTILRKVPGVGSKLSVYNSYTWMMMK